MDVETDGQLYVYDLMQLVSLLFLSSGASSPAPSWDAAAASKKRRRVEVEEDANEMNDANQTFDTNEEGARLDVTTSEKKTRVTPTCEVRLLHCVT